MIKPWVITPTLLYLINSCIRGNTHWSDLTKSDLAERQIFIFSPRAGLCHTLKETNKKQTKQHQCTCGDWSGVALFAFFTQLLSFFFWCTFALRQAHAYTGAKRKTTLMSNICGPCFDIRSHSNPNVSPLSPWQHSVQRHPPADLHTVVKVTIWVTAQVETKTVPLYSHYNRKHYLTLPGVYSVQPLILKLQKASSKKQTNSNNCDHVSGLNQQRWHILITRDKQAGRPQF